jgi:hypothetical protein
MAEKVKANASKHKAMSYDRMGDQERKLREEVAGWFERAEREDEEEETRYEATCRGDELPGWVSNKMRRIEKIRTAKKALEEEARARALVDARSKGVVEEEAAVAANDAIPEPRAQRNFTDPESRIMKGADGFVQAYNCQAAVDSFCRETRRAGACPPPREPKLQQYGGPQGPALQTDSALRQFRDRN